MACVPVWVETVANCEPQSSQPCQTCSYWVAPARSTFCETESSLQRLPAYPPSRLPWYHGEPCGAHMVVHWGRGVVQKGGPRLGHRGCPWVLSCLEVFMQPEVKHFLSAEGRLFSPMGTVGVWRAGGRDAGSLGGWEAVLTTHPSSSNPTVAHSPRHFS